MALEIVLRIFITLYGLAGIGTFAAYMPKLNKSDDEFIASNVRDYIFWLLTSIIFFLYAIFVVTDWRICVFLVLELVVIISVFAYLAFKKKLDLGKKLKKLAASKKKFF